MEFLHNKYNTDDISKKPIVKHFYLVNLWQVYKFKNAIGILLVSSQLINCY